MEWISIKERLPEVNEDVLVTAKHHNTVIARIPDVSIQDIRYGKFCVDKSLCSYCPDDNGIVLWVTHWLNIPIL